MLAALAIVWLMLWAPTGKAEDDGDIRASDFLNDCDSLRAASFLYCVAYLEGISDAVQGIKKAGYDIGICFPEDITIGDSVFAVREWIRENPDYHRLRPVQAVLPALSDVYPCG
jgi:hypothetical protein